MPLLRPQLCRSLHVMVSARPEISSRQTTARRLIMRSTCITGIASPQCLNRLESQPLHLLCLLLHLPVPSSAAFAEQPPGGPPGLSGPSQQHRPWRHRPSHHQARGPGHVCGPGPGKPHPIRSPEPGRGRDSSGRLSNKCAHTRTPRRGGPTGTASHSWAALAPPRPPRRVAGEWAAGAILPAGVPRCSRGRWAPRCCCWGAPSSSRGAPRSRTGAGAPPGSRRKGRAPRRTGRTPRAVCVPPSLPPLPAPTALVRGLLRRSPGCLSPKTGNPSCRAVTPTRAVTIAKRAHVQGVSPRGSSFPFHKGRTHGNSELN